jgi:hypothetical protein
MSAVAPVTSRALAAAATRRIAASSVLPQKVLAHFLGAPGTAPVPSRYERSLRPYAARVLRPAGTIYAGGDL